MIHQVMTRVTIDSFMEKANGKKVILLYPWTNYRNLFLSHFLQSTQDGLLYYRVPQDDLTLTDWMADVVNELAAVFDGFGGNTRGTLNGGSPAAMGEALAADLGAINGERVVLFFDDIDRVEANDDFNALVTALVNALPGHVQLVFSARLLNYEPWHRFITGGEAAVLGTERRRNDVMFSVEDAPKPQVEVYAFGRGHAIVNGKEINNWDGALPRNLFFYFMDNPLVTRDDIFETFWPDLSVKEATNVFHVTKRKISERISTSVSDGDNYELTNYTNSFYMPSPTVVRHYDAGEFQDAIDTALQSDDDAHAERLYREAVDLYRAPFLENMDIPWVNARREHLQRLLAEALYNLGRIHKTWGNLETALGYAVRAVKEAPEREDLHQQVIDIYLAMDMPQDAKQQYKRMEKLLKKKMKMKPNAESRALLAKTDEAIAAVK